LWILELRVKIFISVESRYWHLKHYCLALFAPIGEIVSIYPPSDIVVMGLRKPYTKMEEGTGLE
jgi:hypothetical protein